MRQLLLGVVARGDAWSTETKVGVAAQAHSQSALAQECQQAGGGARKVSSEGVACGWGYLMDFET